MASFLSKLFGFPVAPAPRRQRLPAKAETYGDCHDPRDADPRGSQFRLAGSVEKDVEGVIRVTHLRADVFTSETGRDRCDLAQGASDHRQHGPSLFADDAASGRS